MRETEKRYIESENTSMDNAMILQALSSLKTEVENLRKSIGKTDEEKKSEILAIRDDRRRLKAIEDNMELFKR